MRLRNLIREFLDLRNILILLEVVENLKKPLEEQCSFAVLPEGTVSHLKGDPENSCLLLASWARVAVPRTNIWR